MTDTKSKKGKVVIISGPSGVGKSTICQGLIKRMADVYLSISVTTRPMSDTEIDGRDYWFISEEEFQQRIDNDLLLEHAKVFGHYYGTPKDKIDEALAAGKVAILEIDVQGAIQAKAVFDDAVMIFILPPTEKDLAERLNHRGRDTENVAEERLNGASAEIAAAWQHYEHMVINEDLKQAVSECVQIIEDARTQT
ncbi:MAG: guanylate kinase [Planctomycetota bacterium]|jgi:guanylate kinase